jgi:hypothetical protein
MTNKEAWVGRPVGLIQEVGRAQELCTLLPMEQHTLKNVNNNLNTNIYSYLETSGGQSSNTYYNIAHFFNTGFN